MRGINCKAAEAAVALRKESVDRNMWWGVRKAVGSLSLSARRAWIEIRHTLHDFPAPKVALRKESVDRNYPPKEPFEVGENVALRKESVDRNAIVNTVIFCIMSLSARRAWIEMMGWLQLKNIAHGRSPQGERG